ncbi:hypothetical protein SLA2020_036200 [Shorea laevis]
MLHVNHALCVLQLLSILGINEVYYGCSNDKFGGCGSILSLHSSCSEQLISGGVPPEKGFYEWITLMANAPKSHRPLVEKAAD